MFKALKWAYDKGKENELQRIRLVIEKACAEHWAEVERFNNNFQDPTKKHDNTAKRRAELNAAVGDILNKVIRPKEEYTFGKAPIDE